MCSAIVRWYWKSGEWLKRSGKVNERGTRFRQMEPIGSYLEAFNIQSSHPQVTGLSQPVGRLDALVACMLKKSDLQ